MATIFVTLVLLKLEIIKKRQKWDARNKTIKHVYTFLSKYFFRKTGESI